MIEPIIEVMLQVLFLFSSPFCCCCFIVPPSSHHQQQQEFHDQRSTIVSIPLPREQYPRIKMPIVTKEFSLATFTCAPWLNLLHCCCLMKFLFFFPRISPKRSQKRTSKVTIIFFLTSYTVSLSSAITSSTLPKASKPLSIYGLRVYIVSTSSLRH